MCLQFYYYMSGATTESLNVTVSGNLVFFARGDKGGMWRKASVNLSAIEGLHRVSHVRYFCVSSNNNNNNCYNCLQLIVFTNLGHHLLLFS